MAMFYDEDDDGFPGIENAEIFHFYNQEFLALGPQLDSRSFGLLNNVILNVPTHTEDGIPIRKLYVSNLPPKTTRNELFSVFAQYGFIKSCWLRMGEKGPNKSPTPTYAFVTYSNPADAHKALEAPSHEKILRGRNLRISPADSWHQPAQDADGRVRWKPHSQRFGDGAAPDSDQQGTAVESTSDQGEVAPGASCSEPEILTETEVTPEVEAEPYNILDILNRDCLRHILSYISITDLIRSERVSKRWQGMVQEYLQGVRTYKTSWWQCGSLTTAVLRRLLARAGGSLARLHIDHHWTALNDRTAHTVGKFCPNLDELKLTDSSLVQIVKNDSCIESLTVANNTHVTGLFLTGSKPPKLNSLAFYNCYSLQGTVLCAAIDTLPNLTTLKLDACPVSMWKIIPLILNKLAALEELSLSEYMSIDIATKQNNEFCESIGNLPELRVLNLSKNINVTNAVLKQVAHSCTKLESLNVSSCNARKNYSDDGQLVGSFESGVSDEGVTAVCSSCHALTRLEVSYLGALSDVGLRALPRLPLLTELVSRGNPALSSVPFVGALAHCHALQEVDLCGCDNISEEVAEAGRRALDDHPRPLRMWLAGTAVNPDELPSHKLLIINTDEDLSNPNLRPDFMDNTFEDSSEDSFDDLYEHENFEDFFRGANIYFPYSDEEELYMDDDELNDEDLDGLYAFGIHGQDIILL